MRRTMLLPLTIALAMANVPARAMAAPENPQPAVAGGPAAPPLVYVVAMPSKIALIAWLPADKAPDRVDLDLRVDVVLPEDCGDEIVGLLERKSDKGAEQGLGWDPVISRRAGGECAKHPVRVSKRRAIRVPLPAGQTRILEIGPEHHTLAREKNEVTLDGERAEGDVPGAPPTERPSALVIVALSDVKLGADGAHRIAGDAEASVAAINYKAARFPDCAGAAAIGFLARGDASTRFRLTQFELLVRMPQDLKCPAAKPSLRTTQLATRVPPKRSELAITVGGAPIALNVGESSVPSPTPSSAPAPSPAAAPAAR